MDIASYGAATPLRHRQWVALRGQAGRRVVCLAGSLWVTQDHDTRDVILERGEGFTLDRDGMAIVSALADAAFALRDAAAPCPAAAGPAVAAAGAAP